MTNPNNAVGTNAAYGGRTSVNAFNDDLTIYSRGILSGWACSPKSGMTVQIGGNGADRDAAVAEDNAGNKTSINNISGSPIDVTIPAAPATNNRIDLIVAYADNPPSGTSTVVDNPAACGIIVVSGTAAASPTAPTNAAIRSAITADGATGSTAYYVILAKILVGTGVTTIGSGVITQGDTVTSYAIPASGTVNNDSIDWTTLPYAYAYTDTKQDSFTGVVPYNTFKSNNGFTISGGGLRVPKSGYYRISARMSGFGAQGWLRVHIASSTSDSSASTVVGSGIVRFASGQYHSVEAAGIIAYANAGQYIYARNIDSNFDLNSGMDAGIMGTTISAQFVGN